MTARSRTLAIALVLALTAAGCGGGETTTTPTQTVMVHQGGPPPRKAEFIESADAICKRFNEQTQPLEDRYGEIARNLTNTDQLKEAADLLRRKTDFAREEAQQLRALTPPRGGEDVINNWLTTGESGIPIGDQLADAIEASNQEQIDTLSQQLNSADAKTDGIAQGYGFKVCGQA